MTFTTGRTPGAPQPTPVATPAPALPSQAFRPHIPHIVSEPLLTPDAPPVTKGAMHQAPSLPVKGAKLGSVGPTQEAKSGDPISAKL